MASTIKAHIPAESLEKFMDVALQKLGVPAADAAICADVLVVASKLGIDSHGIERFKQFYYDRVKNGIQNPVTNFEKVREGYTTAVIDGHNGMGHVIAKKSMQLAIDKAKKYGMGMVAVRNSTHYGIAGYYARMATKENMIGITGTNARPAVAPTFGVENMLGTNPLTFGVPTDEAFPFVLDCATSLSQRGKIEFYERQGKQLPEGWVVGADGKNVTDASEALVGLINGNCALAPLGGIGEENAGYKGYGYATVVEIMSAALQQGKFLKALSGFDNGKKVPINLGHFFMAININEFIEPDAFKKTTGDILRELRNSKKMSGQERIYTAGEKEYLNESEREKTGIPVNDVTFKEMQEIQKEQKLKGFDFLNV